MSRRENPVWAAGPSVLTSSCFRETPAFLKGQRSHPIMPTTELCKTARVGESLPHLTQSSRKVKTCSIKGNSVYFLGRKGLAADIAPLSWFHEEGGNFQMRHVNAEEKAISLPVRKKCVSNANTAPDTLFRGERCLLLCLHGSLREVPCAPLPERKPGRNRAIGTLVLSWREKDSEECMGAAERECLQLKSARISERAHLAGALAQVHVLPGMDSCCLPHHTLHPSPASGLKWISHCMLAKWNTSKAFRKRGILKMSYSYETKYCWKPFILGYSQTKLQYMIELRRWLFIDSILPHCL